MPEEPPEPDIFVLLANRRRRLLLRVLREASTPLSTAEVAERIVERECENPSTGDRRAVYLALHHDHLPRLDDAGVITYGEDEGAVAPAVNFDTVVRVLEGVTERDLPWSDQ